MEHYRCQRVSPKDTKAVQVSETLEYRHHYLTQLTLTPEYCVLHGLKTCTCAHEDASTKMCDSQLRDISSYRDVFGRWAITVPGTPFCHRASKQNLKPMAPTTPKQKNTTNTFPPPCPVQTSRVATMLTPADPFPRVDMVPPTVAVDQAGGNK